MNQDLVSFYSCPTQNTQLTSINSSPNSNSRVQIPDVSSSTSEGECFACGDDYAENRRFGQRDTCKPCYSFFRRTVVENKNYKCKRSDKCVMKKAILSFRKDTFILDASANSPLQRFVHCRRSNFTTRFRATIEVYGGADKFTNMANLPKTVISCKNASRAEIQVLAEFLKRSGFVSEEDKGSEFQLDLRNAFLFTWLSAEILFNTVKHLGFQHKRSYFIDDSYMHVDEDKIRVFLHQFDEFYDPQVLAEATMRMCCKVVEKSKRMYELRIDETEMAAVVLILLLRTASRLHPEPHYYKEKLNQLFRELKQYYIASYEDVAIRMDNLMIFVGMIEDIKTSKQELAVLTAINEVKTKGQGSGFEMQLIEQ